MAMSRALTHRLLVLFVVGMLGAQGAFAATVHLILDAYKNQYFPEPSVEFMGEHRLDGWFTMSADRTRILDYSFTSSGLLFVSDVGWKPSDQEARATIFHDKARGIWQAFFYHLTDVSIDGAAPNSQHLQIVWDDDGELMAGPDDNPKTEWYEVGGTDRDYVRHGRVTVSTFSIPEPAGLALLPVAALAFWLTRRQRNSTALRPV